MIRLKNNILFIILVIALTSCQRRKILPESEYVKYLNSSKSGLTITKFLNGIRYNLKMQPGELLAILNTSENTNNSLNYTEALKKYASQINFVFVIDDEQDNDNRVKLSVFNKEIYGNLLGYANTELIKDIHLVQGNDTLSCALVHMEPANSIQPVLRLALAFNGVDTAKKECTLIFNDNLFNNGPLKFHYPRDVFEQLPKLKTE